MIGLKAIRPKRLVLIDPHMTRLNISHGTEAYLNSVKKKLQADYMRVTPTRRYSRSFRLLRGWHIEVSPDGSTGLLSNDTPWAVYAQGPRGGGRGPGSRQATDMRKRGWHSITDIARETKRDYTEIMNRSVKGGADAQVVSFSA